MTETATLTDDETRTLKKALGLDVPGKKTPKRNRLAAHIKGPTIAGLQDLEKRGLLFHDEAAAYGKMRVFRVTIPGAEAIGLKRLPDKLLPSAFLPPIEQTSLSLAA